MSLLNTKHMERHRLMYRQKRNNAKSESNTKQCNRSNHWTQSKINSGRNEVNPLQDVIRIDDYEFVYDLHFLDKLKQLTKELRTAFPSKQSRSKAQNNVQNIKQMIESEKNQLIHKINDIIAAIDGENKEESENSDISQQNSQKLSQTFTQNESQNQRQKLSPDSDDESEEEDDCQSVPNGSGPVYRPDLPLHTQQFLQSFDSKDFRYSDDNYSYDLSSSYDSGFCGSSGTPPYDRRVPQPINSRESMDSQTSSQNSFESTQRRLEIVNRHKWTNTDYNIATGITLKVVPQNKVRTQRKRRKQLKFVLLKILDLIKDNVYCTKRDLYYQNVLLFDSSQRIVDEIIDDLACSLKVSRTKLHIVSSTRGLVFGHLKFFNTNGVLTDCLSSPNGINIPNDTERIRGIDSKAIFVLIVEKDATFQQLIDLEIHKKYPLIMITGHGYPDLNTRAFVHILWNVLEIPIFGLVDGDGHGLEILSTYRHGSLALSYESHNLVAPVIRWMGVFPTDILEWQLSSTVQISLKDADRKKIQDLKERPFLKTNPIWTKQLDILLKIGKKVEIQSLAEHWPTFLMDVYLPAKIRYGKWL